MKRTPESSINFDQIGNREGIGDPDKSEIVPQLFYDRRAPLVSSLSLGRQSIVWHYPLIDVRSFFSSIVTSEAVLTCFKPHLRGWELRTVTFGHAHIHHLTDLLLVDGYIEAVKLNSALCLSFDSSPCYLVRGSCEEFYLPSTYVSIFNFWL